MSDLKCVVCRLPITEAEARGYVHPDPRSGLPPLPPRHEAAKCWRLTHERFDTAVAALVEIAQGRVYRGVRRGFEPTGAAAIARTMLDALGVEWGK